MLYRTAFVIAALTSVVALSVTACGSDDTNGSGGNGGGGGTGATGPGPGPGPGGGGMGGEGAAGGGGDGGMGGAGGGELPTGWAGDTPDLTNDADCLMWSGVSPDASEDGHLYAVRLTPPSWPYTVTEVVYELFHNPMGDGRGCDASMAHRVEVFKDGAVPPPATPTAPDMIDLPAVTLDGPGVFPVVATLTTPITLMQDEYLYVGVEMVTNGGADPNCLAVCEGATITDLDFWSNAATAPYNWATLDSFGFSVHARVGANGM